MKKMPAAKFKAECLHLLDVVQSTRKGVVITKRGKAVAKLVPLELDDSDNFFGRLAGEMEIVGDIMSPVDDWKDWESGH